MRRFPLFASTALLAALAASASAASFTIDSQTFDVEYITGTGANKALLDLNLDPTHSFLFGYQFDGAKTGWDLLNDVAANSNGNLQVDFPAKYLPFHFVDTITYSAGGTTYGNPTYLYPVDPPNDGTVWAWPNYFTSEDAVNFTSPFDYGVDGRTLLDGSVDAWVIENAPELPPDYNPPLNPAALIAVPEPATLGLLSLAASTSLLRRKR